MPADPFDLSILSRARDAEDPAGSRAESLIPPPPVRWKTRIALPGGIVAGLLLILFYAGRDALLPALEITVVPVVSRSDARGGGPVTVQAPGWVEPDPYSIAVSALADGVVEEVLILEGQAVKAGEMVARLVDQDAKLALLRAEADVEERDGALLAAKNDLDAAQRTWDNPTALTRGLAVAEALLAEKKGELARWRAELAAEEARGRDISAEYERLKVLHKDQQASDIEFIRAEQQYLAQKATIEATAAREAVITSQIASAAAEVEAAREHQRLRIPETQALQGAKAAVKRAEATLALARAALEEARLRVERMRIVAMVDGIVLRREVEPGAKVVMGTDQQHSTHIAHLYDPKKLQVRVDVPLADAAAIGVDQLAEIVVNVLPERIFHGRVTRIVQEADIQKNTLQVKVAIEDPTPAIKPEMLARVRFLAPQVAGEPAISQRIFAPMDLISGERDAKVAWVVDSAGHKVSRRALKLGDVRQGDWVEILGGLQLGDRLVADHLDQMEEGRRVRVIGESQRAFRGESEGN